jgi:hypothetical protein
MSSALASPSVQLIFGASRPRLRWGRALTGAGTALSAGSASLRSALPSCPSKTIVISLRAADRKADRRRTLCVCGKTIHAEAK